MRQRYTPKRVNCGPTEPFPDAESAWFWFARCQRFRREGAKTENKSTAARRGCEPDDIYKAALDLHRAGRIGPRHLRILATFGLLERPPDPRRSEEEVAHRLWTDALDRLSTALRHKGLLA